MSALRLLLLGTLVLGPSLAWAQSEDEPGEGEGPSDDAPEREPPAGDRDEGEPAPPEQAPAEAPKKRVYGIDGWGFVTGGGGVEVGARKVHPVGRLSVGVGGNLFVLYGGVSADVSVSSHLNFVLAGVAHVGVLIPIPAFRPYLGFRGGGGLHLDATYGPSPAITLGPEIGVHIGQIGKSRFGIRIAIEPGVTISTGHRMGAFELIGAVGVLF